MRSYYFRKSCRLWDYVAKYCRVGQATDDNMTHVHYMLDTKGYNCTQSGCVILVAFTLQQRLHERALMLRYTYVVCLVLTLFFSVEVTFTCYTNLYHLGCLMSDLLSWGFASGVSFSCQGLIYIYTGLFEMIVGVLTTCHTQYSWDRSICVFLFNRTTLLDFVTYLTGALYVHLLYPGTEGTNQNRHWNHHRWRAIYS